MKEMQVVIDAVPLLLRSAGVKTYLYHWTTALRHLAGERVSLFPFLPAAEELNHETSILGRCATMARLGLLHAANYSPVRILDALGRRCDLFHTSHQLLRPPTNVPVTATLYDVTCWLFPELHRRATVDYARSFANRVIRHAAGLIAISECTKRDAVRVLGIPDQRIEVIYPGVDEEFFSAEPLRRDRKYVLFVGTIEPRKNVAVLLDAYEGISKSVRDEYELLLAGPAGWAHPSVLRRLESGIPGVRYLGYVPDSDLPALTAGAAAFVYPSLYEGFGLPLAQAMAAGVPAITSAVSSLPEVAGGAALLVDPGSVADLRGALEKILLSPELRRDLAARGRVRAECFRWSRAAEASLRWFSRIA
ncbi:MAG: glycosyltransferase family 4 protein [Bryobacterales bacterium]|nr:glycosyltransferase family 4 protein [Bryobacterales bacterium]